MSDYQSGAVTAHGAFIRSQIMAMQSEHQAIIRDVLAAADFWGGTRSLVWKQFMADLGRNFQVIYDQSNHTEFQPAALASTRGPAFSLSHKPSPIRSPSTERRWPASC